MKLSRRVSKLKSGHDFYSENFKGADTISILNTKGNNSAKNVGGVTVVNLCTSSDHALFIYICAKFREIISNGIKVMERTRMINH